MRLTVIVCLLMFVSCARHSAPATQPITQAKPTDPDNEPDVEIALARRVSQLTLREKAGQMVQAEFRELIRAGEAGRDPVAARSTAGVAHRQSDRRGGALDGPELRLQPDGRDRA
jgi:hypothetical protein